MSTASTGNLDCHRHRREDAAKEEEAARGRREASIKHWLACLPFSLPCFFLGLHAPHLRSWLPSGLWIGLPASSSYFSFFFLSRFSYNFSEIVSYVALNFHDASAYFRQESATFSIFIFSSTAKIRKVDLDGLIFLIFLLWYLYIHALFLQFLVMESRQLTQSPRNMYALFWRKLAKREARRSRDRSPISKSPNVLQKMAKAQDAARHRIKPKIKRYVQLRWRMPFVDSVGSCRPGCNKKNKHELIPSFETLKLELNKFIPTSLFLSYKKKKKKISIARITHDPKTFSEQSSN